MLHRGWAITLGVALHLVACGPSGESPQAGSTEYGPWVGSEESDGSVVTVVNESGSVWQRSASLLEESHIGAEAADPEYMLGRVTGLWATDDETYVVDASIPAVRVYDAAGLHLRDIGRQGQGPGEYQRPFRVAVAVDGRVFVNAGTYGGAYAFPHRTKMERG